MIALFTSLLLDYVCSLHSTGRAEKFFQHLALLATPRRIFPTKKKKRETETPQSSINYKNPINFSLGFLPPATAICCALNGSASRLHLFFSISKKLESLFRSLNASQIRDSHWAAERKKSSSVLQEMVSNYILLLKEKKMWN